MFWAGACPRHYPRHVAGKRGCAATGAHKLACDRRPRGRPAYRRRAQQLLGVANDPDGTHRVGGGQLRAGVAHSAGERPEALFVSASRYARDYVGLLRSREFLGYAVGGACATTSLYAFIACAPFIFIDRLHLPSASVGLYLALLVSGLWLGSLLASRLIGRFSLVRFLVVANALSVVAAASFLALVTADRATLVGIIATMFAFSVGVGAAAPAALVQAISVNPRVTGTASGLYGSVQMAVGAALVALAGLGANPAFASAAVLLAAGVVAQASFWVARNHSGTTLIEPESEAAPEAAT